MKSIIIAIIITYLVTGTIIQFLSGSESLPMTRAAIIFTLPHSVIVWIMERVIALIKNPQKTLDNWKFYWEEQSLIQCRRKIRKINFNRANRYAKEEETV